MLRASWLVLIFLLAACGVTPQIGDRCTSNGQCPGSGTSPGLCARNQPSGYCTRECADDGDCDPGSLCTSTSGGLVCVKSCAQPADCRLSEGYACVDIPGTDPRKFCFAF